LLTTEKLSIFLFNELDNAVKEKKLLTSYDGYQIFLLEGEMWLNELLK